MRLSACVVLVLLFVSSVALAKEQTVTLDIRQMDCALCKITIQKALKKVDGVKSAKVSYEEASAVVIYDDEVTGPEALTKATTNAGYPSTVRESKQSDG